MIPYPISIIGYLILGVAGACTFIFLLLIFDKDVAILRNDLLSLPWMIVIYAILGGVISVVVNLSGSPDFGAGQLTLAFSAGMGWPALATGISAAKKVGDVNDDADKRVKKTVKSLGAIENRKLNERERFYNEKLNDFDKTFKKAQQLFEKELDRIKEYYSKRLLTTVGGE